MSGRPPGSSLSSLKPANKPDYSKTWFYMEMSDLPRCDSMPVPDTAMPTQDKPACGCRRDMRCRFLVCRFPDDQRRVLSGQTPGPGTWCPAAWWLDYLRHTCFPPLYPCLGVLLRASRLNQGYPGTCRPSVKNGCEHMPPVFWQSLRARKYFA